MRASTLSLAAAGIVALSGCANDGAAATPDVETDTTVAAAAPSPPPPPSPSPSPLPPPPVVGVRTVETVDVASHALVGGAGREEVDGDAVDAFGAAILDWIDAHLTQAQVDGTGRPADVAGTADLATELVTAGELVADASYVLTLYHDAGPEMATLEVTIVTSAGATRNRTLVFAADDTGHPVLTLAGTDAAATS